MSDMTVYCTYMILTIQLETAIGSVMLSAMDTLKQDGLVMMLMMMTMYILFVNEFYSMFCLCSCLTDI